MSSDHIEWNLKSIIEGNAGIHNYVEIYVEIKQCMYGKHIWKKYVEIKISLNHQWGKEEITENVENTLRWTKM